jgi:hypothetical protein
MLTGTSASTHNIIRRERNKCMKSRMRLRSRRLRYQAVLDPDIPDFLLDRNRLIGKVHLIKTISPSHLQQSPGGS